MPYFGDAYSHRVPAMPAKRPIDLVESPELPLKLRETVWNAEFQFLERRDVTQSHEPSHAETTGELLERQTLLDYATSMLDDDNDEQNNEDTNDNNEAKNLKDRYISDSNCTDENFDDDNQDGSEGLWNEENAIENDVSDGHFDSEDSELDNFRVGIFEEDDYEEDSSEDTDLDSAPDEGFKYTNITLSNFEHANFLPPLAPEYTNFAPTTYTSFERTKLTPPISEQISFHRSQLQHTHFEEGDGNVESGNTDDNVDLSITKPSQDLQPLRPSTTVMPQQLACFGMIYNANTHIINPDELSSLGFPGSPELPDTFELGLSYTNKVFFVGTASIPNLAVINEKITEALQDLSRLEGCRFKAYLATENYKSLLNKPIKTEKKSRLQVDIVIYGPETCKASVGCLLSSKCIYLQHPCHQDPGTIYDNPHILNLADLLALASLSSPATLRSRTPLRENEKKTIVSVDFDESHSSQDLLQHQVGRIFSSLTRLKSLKRLEADIRVKTKLLPHQEQALDFMAQREFGSSTEEFSLWTRNTERGYYENRITGTRTNSVPVETIGGILADDMGLGKTLTVLSTVISTINSGKQHVEMNSHAEEIDCDLSDNQLVYSRATLVIVPSPLLIDGWKDEVELHCSGSLNIHIHHGRARNLDINTLVDYDIVLSTYHTIAAEALESQPPLTRIKWFRVVLDEAHIIRRVGTKLYQAVSMLSAKFRWCLTGTPIQNRLEDLASLVTFIRCSPFNDITQFRKHITSLVMKEEDQGLENLRILLDSICLRRTKKLLRLPNTIYEDRSINFLPEEKAYYTQIQAETIAMIKKSDSQQRRSKDFLGVFQLHLQLRRICNHGTYQIAVLKSTYEFQFEPEQAFQLLKKQRLAKCSYCKVKISGLEDLRGKHVGEFSTCGHLFCSKCFTRYNATLEVGPESERKCFICKRKISIAISYRDGGNVKCQSTSNHTAHPDFPTNAVSSKVSQLINDIKEDTSDGKSIVFSCWTGSLDLVAHHMSLQAIKFSRIDGTYSLSQRQKILDSFQTDDRTRILLMTTGTGAVGLNLTVANRIYILEPQWNPMVEKQAIARVLRLGQHRDVKVIRYFVTGTYEESMRSQQLRKIILAKHMDGNAAQ